MRTLHVESVGVDQHGLEAIDRLPDDEEYQLAQEDHDSIAGVGGKDLGLVGALVLEAELANDRHLVRPRRLGRNHEEDPKSDEPEAKRADG